MDLTCQLIKTAFDELLPENLDPEVTSRSDVQSNHPVGKLRKQLLNNYPAFFRQLCIKCNIDPFLFTSQVIANQDKVGYRKANDGDIKK